VATLRQRKRGEREERAGKGEEGKGRKGLIYFYLFKTLSACM